MIGRTISHYRVLDTLGAGGMGIVYRAEDIRLGRMVALKMVSEHMTDSAAVARFEREARAASALNHPNICTIHEIDEVDGQPFLVMELLEGQTLREVIEKGSLPFNTLLELFIQFADALVAAHDARIVHRDLKPANLFVTRDGRLKVLDFGLAKLLEDRQDASTTTPRDLTTTNARLGTIPYMSPEQRRGELLDARTDLYSFGLVLREAAGRSSPPQLEPIIAKALEEDRDLRYQSAADIRADLKRLRHAAASLPRRRITAGIAVVTAVVIVAAIITRSILRNRRPTVTPAPAIHTIAVLPFKPIVASERDEALELGIADTLIAKISNVRGITVRPLTAVRRYAGLEQDPIEAGRALGVDAVLDGTTHNARDKIRVNARLLRVSDASQLWSGQFDTTFADIFSVYDTISARIVGELAVKLTPSEQQQLRKRDTQNADAYRAYLIGVYYLGRIGRENLEKAIEYFKKATAIDPGYATAYVGMAIAYNGLPIGADFPSPGPEEAAKAAATKAMELDPDDADAYGALGFVKYWYDWDWRGAEELYRRSIALNPNLARTHAYYGELLSGEGRHAEALREAETAQQLDPVSMQVNIITGQILMQAGQYDNAIAHLNRTLEIYPAAWIPQLIIGKNYESKQMYGEALEHYRASWATSSGATEPLARSGHVLAVRGETAKAREILAQLTELAAKRYVPPYNIALVHAGLGENARALDLLERGCRERDARLVFLAVDPAWDSLHRDARYRKLLSCVHIEP